MFVSHITSEGDNQREEDVVDHLTEVAEMAAEFAESFGAESWAATMGYAHDIGKYSNAFQNRIKNNGSKCDHSTAGAYELAKMGFCLLAYCAAGHHGGLPDGGSVVDDEERATLVGRLRKAEKGRIPDYQAFSKEVNIPLPESPHLCSDADQDNFTFSFLTRMLFSCLVDADFLCTERFMQGAGREKPSGDSIKCLCDRLENKLVSFWPPDTDLNKTRCDVLDACKNMAQEPPGVFSLTVPTGGGKTYASLRFALQHAEKYGMRRVIYAIPYTSIIEQNAKVFREVLGKQNVIEHHSNFDFDQKDDSDQKDNEEDDRLNERLRLATENWDAPLIVTTNVQLFESLYASKTSRCRKLHNIAKSVIVLDEAQMLPTEHLEPCIRALAELVHRYGCTVLLCTATQPSLEGLFEKYGCSVREIVPEYELLYEKLRRVTYRDLGVVSDEELASKLADTSQVLCVVNSRKQAHCLHGLLKDKIGDTDESAGLFHLSTLMYAEHRERVLKEIRQRLLSGEPCRVISTSLIEAGVDVDFPVVYRALAGIDSIVQCAGRCNREGYNSPAESIVYVFEPDPDAGYGLPSDIRQKKLITQTVKASLLFDDNVIECGSSYCAINKVDEKSTLESTFDFGSLEAIKKYFNLVLDSNTLDEKEMVKKLGSYSRLPLKGLDHIVPLIPFREAAASFAMISEGSETVIIQQEEIKDEIASLLEGNLKRGMMRRLNRFAVNLYESDIKILREMGAIKTIDKGLHILLNTGLYTKLYIEETGLDITKLGGEALFS